MNHYKNCIALVALCALASLQIQGMGEGESSDDEWEEISNPSDPVNSNPWREEQLEHGLAKSTAKQIKIDSVKTGSIAKTAQPKTLSLHFDRSPDQGKNSPTSDEWIDVAKALPARAEPQIPWYQRIRDDIHTLRQQIKDIFSISEISQPQDALTLSDEQIQEILYLPPKELSRVNPEYIRALSFDINNFSNEQIAALTPLQIQNLTIDQILALNGKQMQNFSFKALTLAQITKLVETNTFGLLQSLTKKQLSVLSPQQIQICLNAKIDTFSEIQLNTLKEIRKGFKGN